MPGLDLKQGATPPAAQDLGRAQAGLATQQSIANLVPRMRGLRPVIIAAVNGAASGGGLALALACDIRLAATSARFNVAFVRVGLSGCDIGVSWLLPRLIGASRAYELMLTGRFVDAAEAERIGLVARVVPDGEVVAAALDHAELILANSPFGVQMTKEVMWSQLEVGSLNAGIDLENRTRSCWPPPPRIWARPWPPSSRSDRLGSPTAEERPAVSEPQASTAAPGWYPDQAGYVRWWDGQAWGPVAAPPGPPPPPQPNKAMAILSHLGPVVGGFILPLVLYLVTDPRDLYTRHHASEGLNFSLTIMIGWVAAFVVFFVAIIGGAAVAGASSGAAGAGFGRGSSLSGWACSPSSWAAGCSPSSAPSSVQGGLVALPRLHPLREGRGAEGHTTASSGSDRRFGLLGGRGQVTWEASVG